MNWKFQKLLNEHGVELSDEVIHPEFKAKAEELLQLATDENADLETINALDADLVSLFPTLHDIVEVDENEELRKKQADADAKAKLESLSEDLSEAQATAQATADQLAKEKAYAEAKAREIEAKAKATEEKLASTTSELNEFKEAKQLAQQEKLNLLNNNRHLDYKQVKSLGLTPNKMELEIMGYRLCKRHLCLEYTVFPPKKEANPVTSPEHNKGNAEG